MNRIVKISKQSTQDVLCDFNKSLTSISSSYSIFYKNGGNLIDIITVVPKYDYKIEKKIYSFETKILGRYSDKLQIDFHLVPSYNQPFKKFIPSGFRPYGSKIVAS